MKGYTQNTTLKGLVSALAALGIVAAPAAQGGQEGEEAREEREEAREALEEAHEELEEAREEAREDLEEAHEELEEAREELEPLKPEVNATLVEGFTIPAEYRTYFSDVPAPEKENVVVRYQSGRAYYVNSDDWKIVRVIKLDPSIDVAKEDAVFVEGYVIPEDRRTRFVEVPSPEERVTVRFYNNTAYYLDPSYRIVRTVPLTR